MGDHIKVNKKNKSSTELVRGWFAVQMTRLMACAATPALTPTLRQCDSVHAMGETCHGCWLLATETVEVVVPGRAAGCFFEPRRERRKKGVKSSQLKIVVL